MGEGNGVRGARGGIGERMGEVVLGPLTLTLAPRGLPAGEVDVAIRPESIVIGEDASGLAGTVRKSAYLGGLMEYTIGTALGDLFVIDMAVDHPRAAGAEVGLRFANHGVVAIPARAAPP